MSSATLTLGSQIGDRVVENFCQNCYSNKENHLLVHLMKTTNLNRTTSTGVKKCAKCTLHQEIGESSI